ncbi:MAG: DEAD/DEAH box helicase [Promethearchaeota archaeon]
MKLRRRWLSDRRFSVIPRIIRKSSPYFAVLEADKETVKRLNQIAERLNPDNDQEPMQFKLEFKKASKLELNTLRQLFFEVDYELSPSFQKAILKEKGVGKFAELRIRKSDLILKPIGFLELEEIKSILTYNAKEKQFHARIMDYYTILEFLEKKQYPVITHFSLNFRLPNDYANQLQLDMVLREYQEDALHRWQGAKKRGVVVLPTGGGKTIVALEAIRQLAETTLIVVPTLDLLSQWREALEVLLHVPEVGVLGGGTKKLQPITVATYDSASLLASHNVTAFGFLIFDEVHHLPSPTYRLSAELSLAPHRLGLTATPERFDELHQDLDRLVGPTVYRIAPKLLEKRGFLAPYEIRRIEIALKPEEKARYDSHMRTFRNYTRKLDDIEPGWQFDTIVKRTVFDPDAREALSNLEKARRVALEASEKIDQVEALLQQHIDEKIILFSRYTRVVEHLSDLFGLPLITHKTKVSERDRILTLFKSGVLTKIVTGQVLDEGIDVPDASVGIIISGTGSKREFIQRLGRLLRPQKEQAILYELVTEATLEDGHSRRRQFEEQELD